MPIKARLTTFDTTMIVVSLVIGIGIFRTPAMVASASAKPVLFFAAWLLGGAISFLGALTFAEIGSRFNKPGAYYKIVAENYHSSLAFMLNWTSVLIVNGAGAAAVAMIGAEYLNPIILPIVFILFLLSISVNVFLTQTRQALFGIIVFISGFPLFLVMRKASRKKTAPE